MGQKNKYNLANGFKVFFETPDDNYSYFFGYYDISPLNKNGNRLLAHRVTFDGRDIIDGDVAEVGYFNIPDPTFHKIGETLAWNWQLGAHLQWLPPDFDGFIIYNAVRDDEYVAIIYDMKNGSEKIIAFPVYAVHPSGVFALGVNYERLTFCRPGYNYKNIVRQKWDVPIHPEDGIFRIDLKTGEAQTIIKTCEIVNLKPDTIILEANNWLEHIQINPGGDRFLFFHRWQHEGVDYSRFFTANIDGSEICMYPDCGFYSHYWWNSDKDLMVWTYEPEPASVNPLRGLLGKWLSRFKVVMKPLYEILEPFIPSRVNEKLVRQSKLVLFKDRSLEHQPIASGVLQGNGHSSMSSDGRYILNDTYQNKDNIRDLHLYAMAPGEKIHVGSFFSTHNDTGYRCDLHPRFCFDDKLISIDSGHGFKRKTMLISLPEAMLS